MIINFENGMLGSLCVGWPFPDNPSIMLVNSAEVVGTKGMGTIQATTQSFSIVTPEQVLYPDIINWPEYSGQVQGVLRDTIQHYVRATISGEEYLVDTDNAIDAIRVIEAAFESCRSGMPVVL
jgi:predicted dehydrogenase